jgi:DnaJ family protein C protein 7
MDTTDSDKSKAEEFKNLGNKEFKLNNYTKAIEFYTKAIDTCPTEASYYANRAACFLGMKKYLKCIEDCNETLKLDPKFTKAIKRKAKSLYLSGKIQEARQQYRSALEIDPSDSAIKEEMRELEMVEKLLKDATGSMENKKYTDALMELKRGLSICPDFNDLKIKQIECLARMGHAENAIQISNACFNDLSANLDFLYARGLALLYNGQPDVAKKNLMEGLRLDPDNEKCRITIKRMNKQEDLKEKGNIEFKSGNHEAALKFYAESIEIDPCNKNICSQLYYNRATVNAKVKKYKEALVDCDKAIELNDHYAKAFVKRADIRIEMEEFDEAVKDLKQAKQADPSYAGINQKIQEVELARKKAARKDYYKLLELPKDCAEEDIKKAYKKNALKWHPDKNRESEEQTKAAEAKFKDISEAYAVLSDPQKKRRYDSGQDLEEEGFGGFGGGGMDPNVIFQTFFGGGGGGGGGDFGGFPFGGGGGAKQQFGGNNNGGFSFSFSRR